MCPMVNETYERKGVLHKNKTKIIILGIFLIILFALVYTSFSGEIPFTGSIINERVDFNNSIYISADLTIPNLSLDGKYEKIILSGGSNSFIYVGSEKFSLTNSDKNYIVLTDYDGTILFDDKIISKLKGKASKISINGISLMPKSKDTIKIYFDEDFNYKFLEITSGVSIKKLNYITSGEIRLENQESILTLDNDSLVIRKFDGSLEARNKHFVIKGYLEGLNIQGEQEISISV